MMNKHAARTLQLHRQTFVSFTTRGYRVASVLGTNRSNVPGAGNGVNSSMIAANDRFFQSNSTTAYANATIATDDTLSLPPCYQSRYVYTSKNLRKGFMPISSLKTQMTNTVHNKSITTRTISTADDAIPATDTNTDAEENAADTSSGMDDEYGEMEDEGQTYTHPTPFPLESGATLTNAKLRYMTYGTLNQTRDNTLVVCHALTGNASLHSWWGDLLGPGRAFDTDRYFIVCCNLLGSCYGSTGPASPLPPTLTPPPGEDSEGVYGVDFPDISVRDSVTLQLHLLRDHLRLSSVKAVVGGSFGGMQTVEFAALAGGGDRPFVRSVVPIACGAEHTAWQIAVSEAQRQAIYADPKWRGGRG